jgi:serine/threonine kinase 16
MSSDNNNNNNNDGDCGDISSNSSSITYLLLPFMERGTLKHLLTKVEQSTIPRPPLTHILQDFVKICKALNVLHSAGYVHQDIKPENILIDQFGEPILADFGSVRIANIDVSTRKVALRVAEDAAQFCTASYRAPELFDTPTVWCSIQK